MFQRIPSGELNEDIFRCLYNYTHYHLQNPEVGVREGAEGLGAGDDGVVNKATNGCIY
jgi:hypothetical protein